MKCCAISPKGLMTMGVGLRLFISRHTVSRHIRNLCKKCGVKNSVHLISIFFGPISLRSHSALTRRENEIFALLARGMTQKSIADATGISVRTVYKHRENILAKLNVRSTKEAVALLFRASGASGSGV